MMPSCELFIDVGPDDAGPVGPDTRPIVDAGELPDSEPARLCEIDANYFDIGVARSVYRVLGGFSFLNAADRCQQDGADLVSINSPNERTQVGTLIDGLPLHPSCGQLPCAWVGLFQGAAAVPEENWVFLNGVNLAPDWQQNQPDDLDFVENGEEDCGILEGAGYRDEPCETEVFAICECELF